MGLWCFLLAAVCLWSTANAASKHLITIEEESWKDVLFGEWMLEFHAPWCPACKDLSKTWNSFADWSKDLDIRVAAIDVTTNPGLSGRFLVTALPTIYHVKDGVFRAYTGSRDKDDMISFIEQKKWTVIDPIPTWKHPNTIQMGVVAQFFKLSMSVRDLHSFFVEKKGLPPAASYAIFGGATLLLGCVLGFLIVCMIDYCFPAAPPQASPAKGKDSKKDKQKQQKEKEKRDKEQKEERKRRDSQNSQSGSQYSQSQSEGEDSADESTVRERKKKEQEAEKKKSQQNGKQEGKKKK